VTSSAKTTSTLYGFVSRLPTPVKEALQNPCLSVLFTGTLDQVSGIISSNADGLASKFIKVLLPEQKE
jgi:hypothetical protein